MALTSGADLDPVVHQGLARGGVAHRRVAEIVEVRDDVLLLPAGARLIRQPLQWLAGLYKSECIHDDFLLLKRHSCKHYIYG